MKTVSPEIQNLSPETKTLPESLPETREAAEPRHRHGKVARLPKPARDIICRMLQDGSPYRSILEKLGPEAKGLSKHHISEWKKGGYLDWQRENQWLEELRAQQQFALEMLLSGDQNRFPHVVLQIAATQVFQALRKVAPDNLNGKFDSDPASYTRLLNSLSRLSRSSLYFTKYEDLRADAKAAELKRRDPNRKLNENECGVLAKAWNDFFLGPDYDPLAHPLHDPPATPEPPKPADELPPAEPGSSRRKEAPIP